MIAANAEETRKPRKINPLPPVEFLRECFEYRPETGELIWKERPRSHFPDFCSYRTFQSQRVGKIAGMKLLNHKTKKPSEIVIGFWRRWRFGAHYAVLLMNGITVPDGHEVDHRDGNPYNNRLENLRVCTHQRNLCNLDTPRNKTSGLPLGVAYWEKTQFQAYITFQRKRYPLGIHKTLDGAIEARKAAELKYFGELSRAYR